MKLVSIIFIISCACGQPSAPATPLLILTPGVSHNNSCVCQGSEIVSCKVALVNWKSITPFESIILPTGDILEFDGMKDPLSSTYKNAAGSEGTLYFLQTILNGKFELSSGKDFMIESLDDQIHVVWAEFDQSILYNEREPLSGEPASLSEAENILNMKLMAKGKADTETLVWYSNTVYYTKYFNSSPVQTKNLIDPAIQLTNEGYINSKVPIRARLHCVMESDIPDGLSTNETLRRFEKSKDNLRNSADATILIVNDYSDNYCGYGNLDRIVSGKTISTVKKGCALYKYSFGHDLAHGFGLNHNRRKSSKTDGYAFGYICKKYHYRSIMAYRTNKWTHEKRKNYYSSPIVYFENIPTGNRANDNARTLTEVRFAVSNIGDESMACPKN